MLRSIILLYLLLVIFNCASLAQTQHKFVSVGRSPNDEHPQAALLMWGPDSVEYNAEAMGSNQTAVQAYRQAYNAGNLDACIEAYYTLQTGYYSPENGLDSEGRGIYESVEEDTRNILKDYDGLERFAALLALFPVSIESSRAGSMRAMIQRLYNERRRHERSWTFRLKKRLRAWLGHEEND